MSKGPAGKVTICHSAGDGKVLVIEVNQNALAAHLAHGDSVPDSDGEVIRLWVPAQAQWMIVMITMQQ